MMVKSSSSRGKTEKKAASQPSADTTYYPNMIALQAEEDWKRTFDAVPDLIAIIDTDFRIVRANKAMASRLGLTPEGCVGLTCYANVHGTAQPPSFCPHRQLLKDGLKHSAEIHEDRLEGDYLVSTSPIFDPAGKLIGSVHVARDITERKQAEAALRHHIDELSALQATVLDLAAQQDLLSLLNTIIDRAMALLDAPGGFIYLYDPKKNDLELAIERGSYTTPGLRLHIGEGMAGRVAQTHQTLVVDDYSSWEGRSLQYEGIPYHAIAEAPMLFGGQLVGVLGINEVGTSTRKYNEADVRLLTLFAGQAASAVYNARLFQGLQRELDERKRAEEALRESEVRFSQAFEQAAIGMALVAPDGHWLKVNRALCELIGYSEEELMVKTFQDITHPADLDTDLEYVRQMLAGEIQTYQMEKRYFHKLGAGVWILLSVSLVRDPQGKPLYFISQIQDITVRKRAETALGEAENRYRTLVEQITAATYIDAIDEASSAIFASPQIKAITGYSPEEWLADPELWPKLIFPDDRPRVLAENKQTKKTGEPFKIEYRLVTRDGRIVWVRDEAMLVRDEVGEPKYWQGILLDITEHKRAEETLRKSEQTYKALIETTNTGYLIINSQGQVVDANAEYVRLSGHKTLQEILGRSVIEWTAPYDLQRNAAEVEKCAKTGNVRNLEIDYIDKKGVITPIEINGTVVQTEEGVVILSLCRDISDRKRSEKIQDVIYRISQATGSTESTDELYSSIHEILGEVMPVENFYISLFDPVNNLISFPYSVDQYDQPSPPKKPGRGLTEYVLRTGKPLLAPPEVFEQLLQKGEVELVGTNSVDWLGVPLKVQEQVIGVMVTQSYTEGVRFSQTDADFLSFVSTQVAQAIERKQAEEQIRHHAVHAEALARTAAHLNAVLELDAVLKTLCEETVRALEVPAASVTLYDAKSDVLLLQASVGLPEEYKGGHIPIQRAYFDRYLREMGTVMVTTDAQALDLPNKEFYIQFDVRTIATAAMLREGKLIGGLNIYTFGESRGIDLDEKALLQGLADEAAQAITNVRLLADAQRRAERVAAITHLGTELATIHEASAVMKMLVVRAAAIMESTTCTVMMIDVDTNEAVLAAQTGLAKEGLLPELRVPLELPVICHFVETGEPLIVADIDQDAPAMRTVLVRPDIKAFFAYPMLREGKVIGLITFSKLTPYTPSGEEIASCQMLAERAAAALENARLFEETNRSLEQVKSLHTIDMTIASSFDLRLTLSILLEQARTQLGVDAVDILIYNPHTQMLDYASGIGFRTSALQGTHLRLGQSYAGMAGLERKTIHISNLSAHKTDFLRSPNFSAEGFDSYFAVPLIAKGQIKGVMEVLHRSPLHPDQNWRNFLETLAKQAAIAVDNASLFAELQSSNAELTLAYDSTLAGWSKALDMRDHETEGHTQRVVEETIRLARAMGVMESELANVRRGALLHDIGKMGIPDSILHKPGPLSAEEWAIMSQHPVYAQEMLAPIAHLRAALDIPRYHHEKWDGSGYPDGLKGEQIPLTARIFAVVDVFDALTSNRPYRSAWPSNKAIEYLQEQAGKHFDPAVVEVFLRMAGGR